MEEAHGAPQYYWLLEAGLSVQQFTPPRITPAVSLSPVSSKTAAQV